MHTHTHTHTHVTEMQLQHEPSGPLSDHRSNTLNEALSN